MLTSTRISYTLLAVLIIGLLIYLVNPWVYSFKPIYAYTYDVSNGRFIRIFEFECIGFIPSTTLPRNIRVAPGELVCYDASGRGVYESLRLTINTVTGYWVYSDIALLYINTTRSRYLEIVVEKPLEDTNLTMILSSSVNNNLLVALSISEYRRVRVEIPIGENTYRITLVIDGKKPIRGVFRVGFYIGSTED
jgi:hypothetical protein